MSDTAKNSNVMKYIHILIMMILMFGVGFLPPFGEITPLGMKVLGCFLGIVYGWIFIDLLWVSFFGFVVLAVTGVIDTTSAFARGFGDPSFLVVLVPAVFAVALNQIGVTDGIAYWLMSRKMFIGRPWALIIAICIGTYLMGIFNGGIAAIFLMWTIALKIGHLNGYKRGDKVLSMLIAFITYIAFTAPVMVPFYGGVLLYGSFLTKATGLVIPSVPMMVCGQIYVIATFVIMLLIAKFVLRVDVSKFSITEELCEEYGKHKTNKYQKAGLILLVGYFAVLMLPEMFPAMPGAAFCKSIGVIGWTIVYMTVFLIWKDEKGESLIDLNACLNSLPWAMLMLLAVTYPLAAAMEAPEVGIMATVTKAITPVLMQFDTTALIILSMIMLGIATQFLHNVVVGAIFIPIIAPIVVQMGGNAYVAWFMIYAALCCAYVTPAGSMMAGMVFGHKEMVRKDAYLYGTIFLLVCMVVCVVMFPLLSKMFVMP